MQLLFTRKAFPTLKLYLAETTHNTHTYNLLRWKQKEVLQPRKNAIRYKFLQFQNTYSISLIPTPSLTITYSCITRADQSMIVA